MKQLFYALIYLYVEPFLRSLITFILGSM